MRTDAIEIELMEIEAMLAECGLSDDCQFALQGAAQAQRWILGPGEWASATQTFRALVKRPLGPLSPTVH